MKVRGGLAHVLTICECFCMRGAELGTDCIGCAVLPHTDLLLIGAACREGRGGEECDGEGEERDVMVKGREGRVVMVRGRRGV